MVFVLHSSEVIFSFLIEKSREKITEIEIAFFHSLENPKGRTLDHFFYASHIRHNFPYKLIPISKVEMKNESILIPDLFAWPRLIIGPIFMPL